MDNQYLMHYGVKGMKWGVRHDYVPTGGERRFRTDIGGSSGRTSSGSTPNSSKSRGQSVVERWTGKKDTDKRKIVRNALIGTALASAAVVGGLKLYKYGKMSSDAVLKPGTLAQSVAVREKADWGKSFYAATGQDDRRKILKAFAKQTSDRAKKAGLSGEVNANMFTNDKTVNIAGRKTMKKAYKSVYGTNRGFNKFAYSFGAKDEAHRQPFLQELKRRGYGGFKDQDGMRKWWGGETPIVLNGDQSGFRLRNSSKINTSRLDNIPVRDIGTRLQKAEERGSRIAKATIAGAAGTQTYISITDRRKRNQNWGRNG